MASILQCRPIPSNSGLASQFNDIVEHVSSGYSSDETSSSYDSEYSSDDDDGSSCSSGYSSDSSLELEVVSRGRSARSKMGVNSNRHRSDRRSRRSPPPTSHYRRSIQKSKKDGRSEEKSGSAKKPIRASGLMPRRSRSQVQPRRSRRPRLRRSQRRLPTPTTRPRTKPASEETEGPIRSHNMRKVLYAT